MAIVDSLGFAVDTSDLRRAQGELKRTGDAAATAGNRSQAAMKRLGSGFRNARVDLISLKSAIGGIGFGLLIRQIQQANDAWTAQTNALRIVTRDAAQLADVQQRLFDLAQDTRQGLGGTVDLYARLARSTQSLGLQQSTLLQVVQTVNKAIAVSGTTAASAEAALYQLGQGLAAGALRGDEFRSVVEQTPRIALALADGLGITIGQLREFANEGELTSELVIAALTRQADVIEREFRSTVKTVSQGLTQIENELLLTFGGVDATGVIDALDSIRNTLADPAVREGLRDIAQGMITVAEYAARAVSSLGGIGDWIGRDIAADTLRIQALFGEGSGPAALDGPIDAVNQQIADLEARIKGTREQTYIDIPSLFGFEDETGKKIAADVEVLNRQLEILKQHRADLIRQEQQSLTGGGAAGAGTTGAGGGSIIPAADPAGDALDKFREKLAATQLGVSLTADKLFILEEAFAQGRISAEVFLSVQEDLIGTFDQTGEAAQTLSDEIQSATQGWASNFSGQLADILFDADTTFNDILRSFGRMVAQIIIQRQLVEPLLGAFGLGSVTASAQGNVFQSGRVVPFANGTVVDQPTMFPMNGGNTGLMGEAGPEAIMPLTRTASGALGVRMEGGGSGGVVVNVYTDSGSEVETRQTRQGDTLQLDVLIKQTVASDIRRGGMVSRAIQDTTGVGRIPARGR